jgi:hypothetical protein
VCVDWKLDRHVISVNPAGIDALEIFMNQAGMALEKALLKNRLAKPLKEKR